LEWITFGASGGTDSCSAARLERVDFRRQLIKASIKIVLFEGDNLMTFQMETA
jgi:hypothetical protein